MCTFATRCGLMLVVLFCSHFYFVHFTSSYHVLPSLPLYKCCFGRASNSYDERRFLDDRYSRDNIYPRNAFHRENYPLAPAANPWPESRRRGYEDEYRESRRHEKPYIASYHEMDTFHEHDIDSLREMEKFRDDYRSIEGYRDHGFDRPPRFGGRDHDDYDDYDHRSRFSHQSREDSRERDYDYGRHSYDSDYDRGTRRDSRDSSWRRHGSRDRERDKRGLSGERDQSPHRRHEQSRSRSRSRSESRSHGRDERPRSRSPWSRNHGRSHREDSFDDGRYERNDKRRDREERYQREQYSAVDPSLQIFPLYC